MKNCIKSLFLLPCLVASPVCSSLPQLFSSHAAVAAENSTSLMTGIVVPRSPVALNRDIDPFTKLLTEVAGVETVNLKPAADEAEVWVWENQWGSEAKTKFTRSALQTALEAGGYTIRDLTSHEVVGVRLFGIFDSDELAFKPSAMGVSDYFVATNETRKSTVVGVWLGGENKLALGLLPIAFKAKPKPKPLPAAKAGAIVVKNHDDTMASLPRPVTPKFAPLARKPRMVRGWLKDASGRPVAGAEVAVYSSIGGGLRTTHKARSNAQGLYEVMIPAGIGTVAQVDKDVTYNGKTYTLYLKPVSGNAKQFNSATGHVENYLLKTTGKAGGTIRFLDDFKEGTLEVTLTPVGLQMDGTKGHTLIYRLDQREADIETYLNGMPLGRYKITARLFDDGEVMPLRVARTGGTDEERAYKAAETIDFGTEYNYIPSNQNQGAAYFEVLIGA